MNNNNHSNNNIENSENYPNVAKKVIPIFFSCDDNYIPFLVVALESIKQNASSLYNYRMIILNSKMSEKNKKILLSKNTENIEIEFANVSEKVKNIAEKGNMRLRDYYSESIYYRLFIPSLFPEYDKAIYLDSDIVLVDDISKMYNEDIDAYNLGVIIDRVVCGNEVFEKYSEEYLGIDGSKYFNSGVLLMNLKKLRENKIEEKFVYLVNKYNFKTIAPDQDYLNVLCKDNVKYLADGWDKMPTSDLKIQDSNLHLIHYNMFQKPWLYSNVPYEEYFWKYAKMTEFYNELLDFKKEYTDAQKAADIKGVENLLQLAKDLTFIDDVTFKKVVIK